MDARLRHQIEARSRRRDRSRARGRPRLAGDARADRAVARDDRRPPRPAARCHPARAGRPRPAGRAACAGAGSGRRKRADRRRRRLHGTEHERHRPRRRGRTRDAERDRLPVVRRVADPGHVQGDRRRLDPADGGVRRAAEERRRHGRPVHGRQRHRRAGQGLPRRRAPRRLHEGHLGRRAGTGGQPERQRAEPSCRASSRTSASRARRTSTTTRSTR